MRSNVTKLDIVHILFTHTTYPECLPDALTQDIPKSAKNPECKINADIGVEKSSQGVRFENVTFQTLNNPSSVSMYNYNGSERISWTLDEAQINFLTKQLDHSIIFANVFRQQLMDQMLTENAYIYVELVTNYVFWRNTSDEPNEEKLLTVSYFHYILTQIFNEVDHKDIAKVRNTIKFILNSEKDKALSTNNRELYQASMAALRITPVEKIRLQQLLMLCDLTDALANLTSPFSGHDMDYSLRNVLIQDLANIFYLVVDPDFKLLGPPLTPTDVTSQHRENRMVTYQTLHASSQQYPDKLLLHEDNNNIYEYYDFLSRLISFSDKQISTYDGATYYRLKIMQRYISDAATIALSHLQCTATQSVGNVSDADTYLDSLLRIYGNTPMKQTVLKIVSNNLEWMRDQDNAYIRNFNTHGLFLDLQSYYQTLSENKQTEFVSALKEFTPFWLKTNNEATSILLVYYHKEFNWQHSMGHYAQTTEEITPLLNWIASLENQFQQEDSVTHETDWLMIGSFAGSSAVTLGGGQLWLLNYPSNDWRYQATMIVGSGLMGGAFAQGICDWAKFKPDWNKGNWFCPLMGSLAGMGIAAGAFELNDYLNPEKQNTFLPNNNNTMNRVSEFGP